MKRICGIMKQNFEKYEIICVNDGSPDNSSAILEEYAKKDNRIKIINQENTGLSGARNTGVKASTGDYIVFLDSDDWMDTEAIEAAVTVAQNSGSDTVLWGYVREFAEKSVEKKIFDG